MPRTTITNPANQLLVPRQDLFGTVAWMPARQITTPVAAGDGTREGIDKWTFALPIDGLYRFTVTATVIAAASGVATCTFYPIINYSDITGTGAAVLQEGSSIGTSLFVGNELSGGSVYSWSGCHRALDSAVSIYFSWANGAGTKTPGTLLWSACAERISV